jgi:ABC-type ATPase with predicted acetyltransferase domain
MIKIPITPELFNLKYCAKCGTYIDKKTKPNLCSECLKKRMNK